MKRLKKGTPGKGADNTRDAFSYTPVGSGLKNVWFGWLAGEPYWGKAHEHKPPQYLGTKPCLTWLTDGALPCGRCKPHTLPTWIGWVPIYREVDHEPCVVCVHETVMDLLAEMPYATRVMVGRSAETSSVYVRRAESQSPRFQSSHEQRQGPRDITPDLLLMWGLPILDQWMRCGPAVESSASDTPMSLEAPETVRTDAAPSYAGPLPLGMDDAVGAATNRINERFADKYRTPSTNGKPKPKG